MNFAIIETGGKQYKVEAGKEIKVEKLDSKKGQKFTFDRVLLLKEGDEVEIGTPYLKNVVIEAELLDEKKDKKIRVARFRAKSRYRRVKGHRQIVSVATIAKVKKVPPKTLPK